MLHFQEMTGGDKLSYALAEKMSSAWLNLQKKVTPTRKNCPTGPHILPPTALP